MTTATDEVRAALERTLRTLDAITIDAQSRDDAALIRDHIATLRAGGERAQVLAEAARNLEYLANNLWEDELRPGAIRSATLLRQMIEDGKHQEAGE